MADICVVGAGPAGSAFAASMTRLGHQVWLLERARFPRRHLGESLSPGVLPLLERIGARERVEAAAFPRVRSVRVHWQGAPAAFEDAREQGLLVDRGEFDRLLLDHARALGVQVLQAARVLRCRADPGGWCIDAATPRGSVQLHADFVAQASGRWAGLSSQRQRTGRPTVALYAYWQGRALPRQPCIEAGSDAWYWGVPLPDGSYNTLVFVDPQRAGAASGALSTRFMDLLGRSQLLSDCRDARLCGPVRAADATSYLDRCCVTHSSIKVGEAALAIDPISSSGVQKALQSALAGAVVTNTLLRRPGAADAALSFYRTSLADASAQHCSWAAAHYRAVAAQGRGEFWQSRADWQPSRREATDVELQATDAPSVDVESIDVEAMATLRLSISPHLQFAQLPCLDGEFVSVRRALRHPNLARPIAYLNGWPLEPLMHQFRPGATAMQLARCWSRGMPLSGALAIAAWLIRHGLLVTASRDCTKARAP